MTAEKYLSFRDAIKIAHRVGIAREESIVRDDGRDKIGEVTLYLKDGRRLVFQSSYEEDYSDDTPGGGICAPIAYLIKGDEK